MRTKISSLLILSMIFLSSMLIIFQDSLLAPNNYLHPENSGDNASDKKPFSADTVLDYSKQGEDIHQPENVADSSQLYYTYKNTTVLQANATIKYLISKLWDSTYKGFNDSNSGNAKKRTFDNMLMIITLLDYHEAQDQPAYIPYAENIFKFEYKYLWNNKTQLFLSYCDYNGNNAVARTNSSDNILAVLALLKLYKATTNQTYLNLAQSIYSAFNSKFRDATNEGYFRSNLTGDTGKYSYTNFFVSFYLAEIYQMGYLSSMNLTNALQNAEKTVDLLISNYLNGTQGFFFAGNNAWKTPIKDKSALINALAIDTLITLYEINFNQTYFEIAVNTAEFIDKEFWDSTKKNRGYNATVSWDGKTTIDATKYLDVNSLIMKSFLRLFEKTYNSTHYRDAINVSQFLNAYLLDHSTNGFNYSVHFTNIAQNSSVKYTAANAWAIQALLNYRYLSPYLTRANTTMAFLNEYMYQGQGFDNLQMYDWAPLSSRVILTYPVRVTLADLFPVYKQTKGNLQAIYTLLELAEETRLDNYILLANKTMYYINQTGFSHAFAENYSVLQSDLTYSTETNAWGILSLLKLYEKTGDSLFLEMANETWYFLRDNLWDYHVNGYNTSTKDTTKKIVANSIMIWANLEIAKSIYPILANIRSNASFFANQTLNIINQKMWDATNFGYYTNASRDWSPVTTGKNTKRTYESCIVIDTLLKYNNFYPNNPNKTIYETRMNKSLEFLLKNLWDGEVGGFYLGCYGNGTAPETDKYTFGNDWATLTFLDLYETIGNFTYYLWAEKTNNFVNTYLWDFEYGGYFHWCSNNGVPYVLGTYLGEVLLSYKFLENQIFSVLALSRLYDMKKAMAFPLIVDIMIQPEQLDRGPLQLEMTLKLIDIEGIPIKQANLSISTSGLYQTNLGENFYGFANNLYFKNQYGTNSFSGNVDISLFLGNFHLSILAYNSSMAVSWLFLSYNRTFDVYSSKTFALLASSNLFFFNSHKGYARSIAVGSNLITYTNDNWMAILTFLDYYNATGLNLFINSTSLNMGQILTSYVSNTFTFLNQSLLYKPVNSTALAFYSSVHRTTGVVNTNIFCNDTALAIITLLKYYQITNNTAYLEMANKTWTYLNTSLWDANNLGYISVAGTWGNKTKYTFDNIWAIMANLAIYNTTKINNAIRNNALKMANLTIRQLIQNIWDNQYLGFYSSFNGSTWVPFNTSTSCKNSEANALAIQMLLQFSKLINNPEKRNYLNYANKTFLFMNYYLYDKNFLGYFKSCNRNGTALISDKTLSDNSLMVSALLDLYRANNYNYTYYRLAEQTIFLIDQYFRNPYTTIYHSESSRYGAVTYDLTNFVKFESPSNFLFARSLLQTDLERQKMAYPLVIGNIKVNSPQLGEIQDSVNITLSIYDSNANPVENVIVLGIIYGKYQVFSFTKLKNNTYYCIVNVSSLAGTITISILAFKQGYSAGRTEYQFPRIFPAYIQKSYETIIALIMQLWSSNNVMYYDEYNYEFDSASNFWAVQALMDFETIAGNILWAFDWFANRTILSYSILDVINLGRFMNSSKIQVDHKNVSGYISETFLGQPSSTALCESNALAIITFLDLYHRTGNSAYLELANNTWLYFNKTFWDPTYIGYNYSNVWSMSKNIQDNCFAIWANLAINSTLGINPNIRAQAYRLANMTLNKINQTLWDNINGSYYTFYDYNWSNPRTKSTEANALMILTFLKFYMNDPSQKKYLQMANRTAEVLIKYFYDQVYGGFYRQLENNFSLPLPSLQDKNLMTQATAILALAELYSITGNTTFYYKAEDTMNFVNTYFAGHFNEYLNSAVGDTNGYWEITNRSGFINQKTYNKYPGTLTSSAFILQAMLKLYQVANSTLPWINATVHFLPPTKLPAGEYCNLTITFINKIGTTIKANLNVTMIGWTRGTTSSLQVVRQQLACEYNAITKEYKIKDVNLSKAEDFYFTIYAKNTSYAVYWNVFYLHRTPTTFSVMLAVGSDYIASEKYWQYTIGEDMIIIEAFYVDLKTYQGIPGATLNFTVYFSNASIWFSKAVLTNSSGWGRLSFGPIPNFASFFGHYNVSVFGSHANPSISPKTWYSSSRKVITLNVDFGISIPFFYPKEAFVAQGDIIPCNVTIKHRMLANLSVNILIYSPGVFIPTTVIRNLTTGYNYFMIDVEVDERTPVGNYRIYINVTFENKVIRDSYFFTTILSAAVIKTFYVPPWIADDDVRHAVIEIEHRKVREISNLSVKISCPALKENPTIQILPASTQQEYYFALEVKENVPYGTYYGEILVQRANYSLTQEGLALYFEIEVRPPMEVPSISAPSELVQNQQSLSAIQIKNNKESPITIKIVAYGDGFTSYVKEFSIDPTETETINIPLLYYKSPWDTGMREYTIEIYYLNASSEYSLIYSSTLQIHITYSLNNILLGYILPIVIIAIAVIWLFWYRDKKKREKKKLK